VRTLTAVALVIVIVVVGYAIDVVLGAGELVLAMVDSALSHASSGQVRVTPLLSERVGNYPFAALALVAVGLIAVVILTLATSLRGEREEGGGAIYLVR